MLTGTLEVQQLGSAAQPTLIMLAGLIKSQNGWGQKGHERSSHSNPSAMVSITFHWTRLFRSDPQLCGLLLTLFPL